MTHRLLSLVHRGAATADHEHERAFLARYDALRAYARRLAAYDHSLADDLIQDAYIQFTLTRPALESIVSLDAYLTALIRNLHISWIRRSATQRLRHVAIEDYESAELAMALTESEDQHEIRRNLVRVCEYGCLRKDRSKAAGVLLLRFFHGFYPAEIAEILRSTPRVVNDWLWKARREARLFVDGAAPDQRHAAPALRVDFRSLVDDDSVEFVPRLQAAIFSAGRPPCPTARELARWYGGGQADALDVARVSHLASCRACLDRVCRQLRMASVDERPPGDRSGGTNDSGRGAGSRLPRSFEKRARQRARDVREHRPRQLHVSVNGYEVGILGVESARNEVRWTVRPDEPIAFTEVHSEQGLRLALLYVERPPEGDLVQRLRVALSDGRHLGLAIDFSAVHPALIVEYVDPALWPAARRHAEHDAPDSSRQAPHTGETATADTSRRAWWPRFGDLWLRPWRLMPAVGPLALVAFVTWRSFVLPPATPGASELLEHAVAEEQAAAPSSTAAVHRTLGFELRQVGADVPVFTHRIEVWVGGGESGARALRVFDRAGRLVAGQWSSARGTDVMTLGVADDVWRTELSAAVFRDQYALAGPCATTAVPDMYTVTCVRPTARSLLDAVYPALHAQVEAGRPSRAVLTLRRPDLRVLRLALTVPVDGVDHVVTIDERKRSAVPLTDVPPDTFVPDPRPGATSRSAAGGVERTPVNTTSLEVRVVDLVDRLAASELLSVRQTANAVVVAGLVTGEPQRRALLDEIATLGRPDAVTIDVRTFDEAVRGAVSTDRRVQILESAVGAAPIEAHVRTRVPDADAAALVRELTPRALAASGRARRHALALRALFDRFGEEERARFDQFARPAWSSLVRRHVDGCTAALEELDALLVPYFESGDEVPGLPSIDLVGAIGRLAQEATTVDDVVASLVIASDSGGSEPARPFPRDVRQHVQRARRDARAIEALIRP